MAYFTFLFIFLTKTMLMRTIIAVTLLLIATNGFGQVKQISATIQHQQCNRICFRSQCNSYLYSIHPPGPY